MNKDKDIVGRRMLLGMGAGVGAMALAAQRAEADVPFSNFAFAATGTPTARTMPDRLSEIKNVRDFGAFGNSTTGGNGADDTAAIQAAVNYASGRYSSANRGTIYFPVGMYRITAPITFETPNINIRFLGEPGATLVGNFADALLKRSVNSPHSGIHVVENLRLINNHASGKGLMIHSCTGAKVTHCFVNAWRGVETYNSSACTVDTCAIIAPIPSATSIGVMAGNATSVVNSDITGYFHGIRHHNLGMSVTGCRIEVCTGAGIMLGQDQDGNGFQSTGVSLAGLSMESNEHGVYVDSGSAVQITASAITSNFAGNNSGIYLHNAEQVVVSGVSVSGGTFDDAAIYMNNAVRCVFEGVRINVSGGTAWRLPIGGQLASCEFRATTPVVEGSVTVANLATYGSDAPIGTILRVSNANTSSIGARITSGGVHNVMALKIQGNKWTVLGPGT